jgi:hypothetical protein
MTRARHHNLACVVTEPAGDEHQRKEPPTAVDVLASALRKTSNEPSATQVLREELDHHGRTAASMEALLEGLRQSQAHTVEQVIRRQARQQALTQSHATPSPEPSLYQGVEL